jgi:2-deoxy-D-gluconate 3-dehydrogenase
MGKELTDFSLDIFSLKGKVAMITGANQGLGMAYAVALAKAGADLFIPHFTNDISEIKMLVEECGRKVAFLQGDLTEEDYRKAVLQACIEEYGKIDILINNAGNNYFADFLEFPDEAFQKVMDLQLCAVYYLGHDIAKEMAKRRSGKIINIASALSFTADTGCPPYVIAKHGIVGLTRSFANELGKYNIQVNAIAPGFFASEVNRAVREDKVFHKKICDHIPLSNGKWGDLYDLMGTAVFLASDASNYISGWIIGVDGGFRTVMA